MADAGWSQADIDALRAAIATGARRVRYSDREVEYHDLNAMRALLADIVGEVGERPAFVRLGMRKGFDL
jgi:hypothetical protein